VQTIKFPIGKFARDAIMQTMVKTINNIFKMASLTLLLAHGAKAIK
jgi:hypothetical protein